MLIKIKMSDPEFKRSSLGAAEADLESVSDVLALDPAARQEFMADPVLYLSQHGVAVSDGALEGPHKFQLTAEVCTPPVAVCNANAFVNVNAAALVNVYAGANAGYYANAVYQVNAWTSTHWWAAAVVTASGIGRSTGGFTCGAL